VFRDVLLEPGLYLGTNEWLIVFGDALLEPGLYLGTNE